MVDFPMRSSSDTVKTRENVVTEYFQSWIKKDHRAIEKHFAGDAQYVESHGPAYTNRKQILQWFADWNHVGKVYRWDILRCIPHKNEMIVEWYFECQYKGQNVSLDGISIIEFTKENTIAKVREFQSRSAHYYPYGGVTTWSCWIQL